MKKRLTLAIGIITFNMIFTACSNNETAGEHKQHQSDESSEHTHSHSHSHSGDIRETTQSIDHLPSFLKHFEEDMAVLYHQVANHRELLEQLPCFCGCGESVGHMNNYDCFVFENKEDGSITWDSHATKCGVCLEIAAVSISEYNRGKSIKEIREMVDEKYSNGYAKPTPTPEL